MKRVMLIFMLIFSIISLSARAIDISQARNVASMKIQIEEKEQFTIENEIVLEDNDETLAYIFQLAPQGFIIVSTNTDISPLIAYSFNNNFVMDDVQENTGLFFLKTDMRLRKEALAHTNQAVITQNNELWQDYLNQNHAAFNTRDDVWPPDGYSPTEGWVETQWDQSAPYFSFCPIDPGTNDRCVTGCVATSMAQIMNYHHFIGDPSFTDSDDYYSTYTYPSIHIDNDHDVWDFPSFPELNDYLDDLKINLEAWDDLTNDDLAALNFAAGVSVEMGYSSGGSGAYSGDIAPAMINKFGYDTATTYSNINATFYNNLNDNLINAKPAIFGITGSDVGHSIICDGYNETDNTNHLNMGWGGNSDGWYTLPAGMPAGYNAISRAVINIEGGPVPFDVSGQVVVTGAPVEETLVTLDGPRLYEKVLNDPNGMFEFDFVVEGQYTCTAMIELDQGGYFFESQEIYLDPTNSTVIFFPVDYSTLTAQITAPISPEGTHVAVYDGNNLITSGIADADGNVNMIGILPGDYFAVASLNGNYFDATDYSVDPDNQNISFTLEEYPYDHTFSFAGAPEGQFSLLPTLSCGIRLTGDNLTDYEGDALAKVKFVAPYDPDVGQIFAQIWHDNVLISEKEVTDFTDGEWVSSTLDNFAIIDPAEVYYVGYKIVASAASPAAYHDAGPWLDGKGAYIKTAGWIPIPPAYDYNFCIKGIAISQTPTGTEEIEIPYHPDQLNNNFPNPFNPTTTISYSVKKSGNVTLEIFNTKGQKIKTLINKDHESGNYTVSWDGKDGNNRSVSSGIYFYKMQAGGRYTSTKKMILLK